MAKKEDKGWKHELARDFLAIGSWVFYALVIIRLLDHRPYVYEFIISLIVLVLFGLVFKDGYERYVARGLVLTILTIIYYNDNYFSMFAPIVFIGLASSARYLGSDWRKIFFGIVIGSLSAAAGYYLTVMLITL